MSLDCSQKFFLLGLGAQKAGTTWLYSELTRSPQFDGGFRKEYHVFDTLYASIPRRFVKRWNRRLQAEIGQDKSWSNQGMLTSKHLSFCDNIDNYFDYFHYLLLRSDKIHLSGDITPSYSLLDASALDVIKQGFAARDIPVKVVFLMRDPVERLWSSARMRLRNHSRRGIELALTHAQELELISNYSLNKVQALLSRYDFTIQSIDKVYDDKDVYYGFYETMFSSQNLGLLKEFLGMRGFSFNVENVYNESPKKADLPAELIQEIKSRYQPVYDFVNDRYGSDAISHWH